MRRGAVLRLRGAPGRAVAKAVLWRAEMRSALQARTSRPASSRMLMRVGQDDRSSNPPSHSHVFPSSRTARIHSAGRCRPERSRPSPPRRCCDTGSCPARYWHGAPRGRSVPRPTRTSRHRGAAGRELPLRLGRKTLPRPHCVGAGVTVRYLHDGVVLQVIDRAAGPARMPPVGARGPSATTAANLRDRPGRPSKRTRAILFGDRRAPHLGSHPGFRGCSAAVRSALL